MEKRALLAFGLSALLLFGSVWLQSVLFPPPPAPKKTEKEAPAPAMAPAEKTPAPGPAPTPATKGPATAEAAPAPRPPQRTARVEAPLYRAVVSSDGGKFQDWTLHYRGERPMVIVGEYGPGGLAIGPPDAKRAEPVPMAISTERLQLDQSTGRRGELELQGQHDGLAVRQRLGFDAATYTVQLRVEVRNTSGSPRAVAVSVPWSSRLTWGGETEKFFGQHPIELVWSVAGRVDRAPHAMYATLDQIEEAPALGRSGEWIAIGSTWYLAALLPRSPDFKLMASLERPEASKEAAKVPAGRVTIELRATPTIAPGETWKGEAVMFIGPKEYELLSALGLEETLNFGGFPIQWFYGGLPMRWLGVPILLLMKWVYEHVGNYGVAIILLTVISKVLFYPLTVKSMRSMKAMQALSPQINALRTKYKSDPQRLQRETMELYRKYRVNPMGGCLPMLAQLPIFYALYLALSVSVELQNATFFCFGRIFGVDLWICDLAAQDPTYILPVLMGVTMFVQQKMTPTVGDPRQAKMMLVMPFVFTIMFVNLPAGLVLYWTVSNILQIVQQWYMDRPHGRGAAREAKDASGA